MAKAKRTRKLPPIYKPGYVESELRRIADNPHLQSGIEYRYRFAMLAAAMLMILDRLPENGLEQR